jgi:hypothetical protein
MYTIQKDWKEYRVFLPDLNTWLEDNAGLGYLGMIADANLRIHFEEQPGYEVEGAIDAMWDSLTEEEEAARWAHYDDLNAAEADAKEAILTADWDDMIVAERKLAMSRALTALDREALLVKYPQS